MKVNELRIGNYLLCGNKTDLLGDLRRVVMVLGVDNSSIMYCENYETSGVFKSSFLAENFSPIPLTEEWLVRFGDIPWLFLDKDGYYFTIRRAKVYVLFVHSLQNAYFCIEGKEMKW